MHNLYSFLLSVLFLFSSCSLKNEKEAWAVALNSPTNQTELVKFLQHYKGLSDKKRYKAACFLIRNMPDKSYMDSGTSQRIYDVDVVVADSLIASVEYSFSLLETSPYLNEYSFDDFCEYILPYRVANEPLTYYWKWDCRQALGEVPIDDRMEAAKYINSKIHLVLKYDNNGQTSKSYTEIKVLKEAKCDDRAVLLAMSLRAYGIPAAFEFIPYWGNSNNGHSFCSVVDPKSNSIPFHNTDDDGTNLFFSRKVGKVFRKIYSRTYSTPIGEKTIPALFLGHDIVDVTDKHQIESQEVRIYQRYDYLALFSPQGWVTTAVGAGGKFKHVGTGLNRNPDAEFESLDMVEGILYLPHNYSNNEMSYAQYPIVVSSNGVKEIVPDPNSYQKIAIDRKFPLNKRKIGFANEMTGGLFEGSDRADFTNAKIIHRIDQTPSCRIQRIVVETGNSYRYIRYVAPKKGISIAELTVLNEQGEKFQFKPMASLALTEFFDVGNVFDNNPLTYLDVDAGVGLWVGCDLGRKQSIRYIGYAPRNDDNSIVPGERYELFWWNDGEWISLGQKVADDYVLTYDRVPKGALLWLRNWSRGREERPFIYENNSQQWL